jgi:hypothetical protein
VDPDSEDDEADIYVLAVAVQLRAGGDDVCVLTQERNDIPKKLSLATACGALDLICLNMPGFLHRTGLWQMP